VRAASKEDLLAVMKEWFRGRQLPGNSEYKYAVITGWSYEDVELYVYSPGEDYYWCERITAGQLAAATSFGECYGKAMQRLRDAVWEQEDIFLRGYH
jgi:hypothetical protein